MAADIAQYDVVIVGAGVVGCAIARELSKFQLKVLVVEKELDVGMGTSSRNSGVIHSGIHYSPGSLRAKLNVQGNFMFEELCKALKVKMSYIGKLTVAQDDEEIKTLYHLKEQGEANGVPGMEILPPEKMELIQPGVQGKLALYTPSTGIVCPYTFTIRLAESAHLNGVKFLLGTQVTGITRDGETFQISTHRGDRLTTRVLINSAGLYSDAICRMLGIDEYKIYPCRGEYLILDKRFGHYLKTLVYPTPHHGKAGLGIHLTKTVDENILIGPSNEYVEEAEDIRTTKEIMGLLIEEGKRLLPGLSTSDVIRSFSGLRAKQTPPQVGGFKDFVIERRRDYPNFINLVGIESPGLTSSPAIALMVKDLVGEVLPLVKKEDFKSEIPGMVGYFHEQPEELKNELLSKDKDYGEIVCRCEGITKKEVMEAFQNLLGVKTLAALKYRARVMMGRCQGGFCLPRIVELLRKEFGVSPQELLLHKEGSYLFTGYVR